MFCSSESYAILENEALVSDMDEVLLAGEVKVWNQRFSNFWCESSIRECTQRNSTRSDAEVPCCPPSISRSLSGERLPMQKFCPFVNPTTSTVWNHRFSDFNRRLAKDFGVLDLNQWLQSSMSLIVYQDLIFINFSRRKSSERRRRIGAGAERCRVVCHFCFKGVGDEGKQGKGKREGRVSRKFFFFFFLFL